jgi:hypothetical protein
MTDLIKILNNPEEHYPGNFNTPQRANALLTGLCQDAATEIAKLQAEVLEQCRINGMSAEREDALRAELTRLKASIALDKMAENARELGLDYEPAPVQDAEGENKAVRSFLMLYGQPGLTVGQMKKHMARSGFTSWPEWVETEPHGAHLTKAGAQLWIRHLFALEPTPPAAQPAPVKTYHDGKPWPVAPKPWVGLTDEDKEFIELTGGKSDVLLAELVESKLKEKNT